MNLLIRNGLCVPCDEIRSLPVKADIVIRDGRIEDFVPGGQPPRGVFDRTIDASGKIIIPGLINAHMHSYASLTRSLSGTAPLETWMLSVTAGGRLFEPEDNYVSALLAAAEMLKSGTTACLDHLAQPEEGLEAALRAYEESGMRAVLAPMISDRPYFHTLPLDPGKVPARFLSEKPPQAEELIAGTLRLYERWNGRDERLYVMFGPSGPQRCSDDLLKRCAGLAEELGTGTHTHVLETRPQALAGLRLYGRPMVCHLEELGVLSERISFAHGVWLSEEESRLAANRGVSIVHNPASNLRLGSGTAPLQRYRALGIRLALGTDGVNCGGTLNMFDSMRLAAILHNPADPDPNRWIRSEDVLEMATHGGARALGLTGVTGALERGKSADLVILDPARSAALVPCQDAVAQIVYSESGCGVDTVIVRGRILVENGTLTAFDEDGLRREAERRSELLMKRYGGQRHLVEDAENYLHGAAWEES